MEHYGEGGETVRLAKKDRVPFYTWEPEKNAEINLMTRKFTPRQVAIFYSLRPYFSNFRFGKPANPDEKMQEYINSRTNYDGIRAQISDVAAIDSFWKAEFPGAKDWRDNSDEYGWPKGWLSEIFDYSNQARDIHMCAAIIETVRAGKKVFLTMGSSHAFRIEQTLKHALK
ncbi:hypothetical protein ACFSQD_14440 [Flavihumibacter stibioxidans]|uniref:Uncharacterized protein n=1 Tax=Flavihumibacter stibioxidans TaxID=1834163 RepID=A0ABR7M9B6_9BACT|nr:hypothetical protein [Flavihumibacter stibioxidans]MBC6491198.1 hypothetical protein [Flavihumibacter stibioxidans]